MRDVMGALVDNLGSTILSVVAVALAWVALHWFLKLERLKLAFEEKRFKAEEERYRAEAAYREQEYDKLRADPAEQVATHLAELLRQNPDWARTAMEAANLTSYAHTIFGERSQHFTEEKNDLARRFEPYLLARCRHLIGEGERHVFLLIDAGTTLYPFFKLLGQDTARAAQRGEAWLENLHLATNNLPGLEQLMRSGKRVTHDRYSSLAIEDCQLLPGIPMPVFAAVAGRETEAAIKKLRSADSLASEYPPIFIALVVGNWVRIRRTEPRCPVPMARGRRHCHVKDSLVDQADEVFVISPLAKNFVGQSKEEVNTALGFDPDAADPEKQPYEEVKIFGDKATRVKLISTFRNEGALLHHHSVQVEEALRSAGVSGRDSLIGEVEFSKAEITDIPHLLFEFSSLPETKVREAEVEFPHYRTRRSREFLRMFHVDQGNLAPRSHGSYRAG